MDEDEQGVEYVTTERFGPGRHGVPEKPAHTVRFEKVTLLKREHGKDWELGDAECVDVLINATVDGRQHSYTFPARNPGAAIAHLRTQLLLNGKEAWFLMKDNLTELDDSELPF